MLNNEILHFMSYFKFENDSTKKTANNKIYMSLVHGISLQPNWRHESSAGRVLKDVAVDLLSHMAEGT